MSAPLSGVQHSTDRQTTGMFGGPRGRIAPRGSYVVQGVGDPAMGYSGYGYFWGPYTQLMSGSANYAGMSTITGVPVGTPNVPDNELKVGGGPSQAEVPDYGGTAAY